MQLQSACEREQQQEQSEFQNKNARAKLTLKSNGKIFVDLCVGRKKLIKSVRFGRVVPRTSV